VRYASDHSVSKRLEGYGRGHTGRPVFALDALHPSIIPSLHLLISHE
jgi:hypothetical protein